MADNENENIEVNEDEPVRSKRIIELEEADSLTSGMYFVTDAQVGGSKKVTADLVANTIGGKVMPLVAPAYNPLSVYDIGEYVTHEDKLYRCIVQIETTELWTPAHWQETTYAEEAANAYEMCNEVSDNVESLIDTSIRLDDQGHLYVDDGEE